MLEGYLLRQKQQQKQQSYFTACLMSCMATKPVKPEDLYFGLHPEDKPDPAQDREDFLKAVGLPSMNKGKGQT